MAPPPLPDGWTVARLDDLFHFLPTASHGWADLSTSGSVRYVHYGDLHTRFDHYIDLTLDELPRLRPGISHSAEHLRNGDLIVADASQYASGVGKSAEIRGDDGVDTISGLHTFLLRPKDGRSVPGYRGYLLENDYVRSQIRSLTTHVTVFGISRRSFATIDVPLPPPREQSEVVEMLSDLTAQLDALDVLIRKKRAMKTAVVQELLSGRTRLPGFTKKWHTHTLSDVASILKGSGLSKATLVPDGQTPCIHYGELFTMYAEQIDSVISATSEPGPFVVSHPDDVLMPTSDVTPNGLCTASCVRLGGVAIGSDILILRPVTQTIVGVFLAYTIRANRNQVMQRVSGTTVFHLRVSEMASVEFRVPELEEQSAVVRVFSDMDAEIRLLRRTREKLRSVRRAVCRRVLDGHLPCHNAESLASSVAPPTPRENDGRSAVTRDVKIHREPEGRVDTR